MEIEKSILDKVNVWLTPVFDSETQAAIKDMMTSSPKELEDSFYRNLEFGTGGMRGIMGPGSNRINKYTLGKATQGLSDYLHTNFPNQEIRVAIAYDCRNNSDVLSKVVADVFSANGIKVFLFEELRPTPELSFAVKELKCQAGIVLTASHNPPEYNGYKVYWEDGGQLVPPHDKALIEIIGHDIDVAFIKSSLINASFNTPAEAKTDLKIVYTPLHGTSVKLIPDLLEDAGYSNVHIVAEQAVPNGNFPTVKSPNPEEPEALSMAIAQADDIDADVVIGTDPDADRLGVAVRNGNGIMTLLNGNQTMILMTEFLLNEWQKQGKLDGKQFIGSTIVSTPMMQELASAYGIECKVGLTGFKWIAKMIVDFPEQEFIGGGEESFGYMVGDAVRDKDAITSTLLLCEIAAQAKAKASSLFQELLKLYVKYGFYKEYLISITKKGKEGAAEIRQMMHNFRENPFKELNGQRVIMLEDYEAGTAKNILTGEEEQLTLPKGDVLIYYLEDGSKLCCRPSGTEPKIKFYFSVNEPLDDVANFKEVEARLDEKIKNIVEEMGLN